MFICLWWSYKGFKCWLEGGLLVSKAALTDGPATKISSSHSLFDELMHKQLIFIKFLHIFE